MIHSNTTREEFVEYLYRSCQDAGMPVAVMDRIEELLMLPDLDKEIEALGENLGQAEHDRDDLREELQNLTDAVDDSLGHDDIPEKMERALAAALNIARRALERHE